MPVPKHIDISKLVRYGLIILVNLYISGALVFTSPKMAVKELGYTVLPHTYHTTQERETKRGFQK